MEHTVAPLAPLVAVIVLIVIAVVVYFVTKRKHHQKNLDRVDGVPPVKERDF